MVGLSCATWGCADAGRSGAPGVESGFTSETGTESDSSSGAWAPDSEGSSSEGETEPGLPPVDFDVGMVPDPGEVDDGCQAIDFLFVIDNSSSMSGRQDQLLASFSGFIDSIEDSLSSVDSVHVGVITTDSYDGNEQGCNGLGDLVTKTWGSGSSHAACGPFVSGLRFADERDSLDTAFPCMAKVGVNGSALERPVTATIAALGQEKAAPGACNEGFLRDDAILVVVMVTDDPPFAPDLDDAHPDTDTSGWFDAVVAAKGGDVDSIVMIGFVPMLPLGCTFAENTNLIDFVERFGDQGILANVCESDFAPVFTHTVDTIVSTCENFAPPQ